MRKNFVNKFKLLSLKPLKKKLLTKTNPIMSQFYKKIDLYKNAMYKLGLECDPKLLTAVTKGLGPSIYKADAETVSGSDANEMLTVKTNFLSKKLGINDESRYDDVIEDVVKKMGKSNKNKYRAIFYYLLVKEFRREYVYE